MANEKRLEIKAEKRKTLGRAVKKLRQDGILPGNVYGKDVKSLSIQLDQKTFLPIFTQVGETGLVDLKIGAEEKTRPVLIHNVQLDPVTDKPLHVDFYQVNLKQKVTAKVPVVLVGEPQAIKEKIGILIQPLNEVEIEALPTDIPEKIEINVGNLKAVNEVITVADYKLPENVKMLTATDQILAKIEPPAKEEEVAPPPAAEGEVPAEGEAPTEGAPTPEGQPTEATGGQPKPAAGQPAPKPAKGQPAAKEKAQEEKK